MILIGIDLAFANMGLCRATWNGGAVKVEELKLVSTENTEGKSVRKSSSDLRRAQELYRALTDFCAGADLAFVEVPHGSQSARASWALGISVGVLSSCTLPLIQVTALEVKLISAGKKNASKDDLINWAIKKHPEAKWLRHAGRVTNKNEHLADAIATIHAGMNTDEFKRMTVAMKISAPQLQRRKIT